MNQQSATDGGTSQQQNTIDSLKLALKATGPAPSTLDQDSTATGQPGLNRDQEGQTSADIMKTLAELENDEKIEFLSRKIDEQITDLDQKLDHVLEKHEKDFLKAYRVQMLKV